MSDKLFSDWRFLSQEVGFLDNFKVADKNKSNKIAMQGSGRGVRLSLVSKKTVL